MDRLLSQAALKDGTSVEVRLVVPPQAGWADRMHCLLKHKGMPWQLHWQEAFEGRCDVLETRFYLLAIDGEPISNIMTAETAGIGIFGHVYTRPTWRQKGAASILMKVVCDDFASRDGIALYLGTIYEGMPWRLYAKFGFEGFLPGVGLMRWVRRPQRLAAMFAGDQFTVRPIRWGDWPLVQCLCLQPGNDSVKNIGLKRFGVADMECGYLRIRERMLASPDVSAVVATGERGMVVGFGTAMPLDASMTDYVLVDVFANRSAAEIAYPLLLKALQVPANRPLLAATDESAAHRRAALEAAGFASAGHLPDALNVDGLKDNLLLMIRK
jgi:GNAT superfamily N-acetyltransferase